MQTARHWWEGDIKMDLEATGYKSVDYIHLSQNMVQLWDGAPEGK
jgi:hypothetical protein